VRGGKLQKRRRVYTSTKRVVMKESEKDRLATEVAELRMAFDLALSDKRKYPVQEFKALVETARRYIEMTAADPMIHKSVASAVNGLGGSWKWKGSEFLEISCSRQTGWSASSSLGMIRVSMTTSLPACDLRPSARHGAGISKCFLTTCEGSMSE
jgi:hypothetical protein